VPATKFPESVGLWKQEYNRIVKLLSQVATFCMDLLERENEQP